MAEAPIDVIRRALKPRLLGTVPAGQPNEGAQTWEVGGAEEVLEALQAHRDAAFAPGNDKLWGEGGWARCDLPSCRDMTGWPTYHAKDFHGGQENKE